MIVDSIPQGCKDVSQSLVYHSIELKKCSDECHNVELAKRMFVGALGGRIPLHPFSI